MTCYLSFLLSGTVNFLDSSSSFKSLIAHIDQLANHRGRLIYTLHKKSTSDRPCIHGSAWGRQFRQYVGKNIKHQTNIKQTTNKQQPNNKQTNKQPTSNKQTTNYKWQTSGRYSCFFYFSSSSPFFEAGGRRREERERRERERDREWAHVDRARAFASKRP